MKNYLLDTCVLSEYVKKQPNIQVIQWLDQQAENYLFLSILTIAELKKGIIRIEKQQPTRSQKLNQWLDKVKQRFTGRILPITSEILDTWAALGGQSESQGQPLPMIDSLLVATAIEHEQALVTRNIKDFQFAPIEIINPWESRHDGITLQ